MVEPPTQFSKTLVKLEMIPQGSGWKLKKCWTPRTQSLVEIFHFRRLGMMTIDDYGYRITAFSLFFFGTEWWWFVMSCHVCYLQLENGVCFFCGICCQKPIDFEGERRIEMLTKIPSKKRITWDPTFWKRKIIDSQKNTLGKDMLVSFWRGYVFSSFLWKPAFLVKDLMTHILA